MAIPLDRVVEAHNAIRDARTARRHAWEKEDAALEEDQHKLKLILLEHLNTNGAKSIVTNHGTAYRREIVKPSAADWGAIWDWMKANDAPDLVERRLKTKFITDYAEEHGGQLPPGINVHREFEVSVRRANMAPTTNDTSSED